MGIKRCLDAIYQNDAILVTAIFDVAILDVAILDVVILDLLKILAF